MSTPAYYYDTTVGFVPIGTLPSDEFNGSTALGIADNSWVVGYNSDPFFGYPEAFIWTPENGLMSFGDFLDLWEVPYPAGAYFYSCTDISGDGSTIVGNWIPTGGFSLQAFKVVLEGVVAAFLSDMVVAEVDGGVDLSFEINGNVLTSDFELVARLDNNEWTVPIERQDSQFVAHDNSPNLKAGGSVTYSLYYFGPDGRELLRNETVELNATPELATQLVGAYPNPFNPQTKIAFTLRGPQHVKLFIYDAHGRRVAELADQAFDAGSHSVEWNGRNSEGQPAASGTYFIQMTSEEGVQVQKATLVK